MSSMCLILSSISSVSALSCSLNYVVLFFVDHCIIQDHIRGSAIGKGRRVGEIYFLDLNSPLVDIVGISNVCSFLSSFVLSNVE